MRRAPGAPQGLALTLSPGSVAAGGFVLVSGVVQDVYGDPVAGVPVTLTDMGAGGSFSSPTVTTQGDGSFSSLYQAPTAAGNVTVSAAAYGTEPFASATLVVTAGVPSPSNSQVRAAASVVTAGSQDISLSVTVEDQYGNPVPGLTVNDFSVGSSDLAAGILGVLPVSSLLPLAGSPGAYTLVLTDTDTNGGNPQTLTVSADDLALGTTAVTVLPAPVSISQSSLSPLHPTLTAGQPVMFTLQLADAYGNPVTGMAPNIQVGTSDPAHAQVGPVTAVATSPGEYTFALLDTKAGSLTVEATVAGQTFAQAAAVAPAPPATVSISASPLSVPAEGTVALSGVVQDVYGNPVPGVAVTLADGGAGGSFSVAAPVTQGDGSFAARYQAPRVAQAVTLTAVAAPGLKRAVAVAVTPAVPSTQTSSLVAQTSSPAAGAVDPYTLVLEDAYGNPVSGLPPSAFAVQAQGAGAADVVFSPVAATSAPGVYTFAAQDQRAETFSVAVTVGGVTLVAAPEAVTAGPPAGLTVLSSSVAAGSTALIRGTVTDAYGNPVSGAQVFLTAGPPTAFATVTTEDGTFQASWTAPVAPGLATVTATVYGTSLTAAGVLWVTPPSAQVAAATGALLPQPPGSQPVEVALAPSPTPATAVFAVGLSGAVDVAEYGASPEPGLASARAYFHIGLVPSARSGQASLTVQQCAGAAPGEVVFWWDGSAWAPVFPSAAYDATSGCLVFQVTATSSPSLAELADAPFAGAVQPSSPGLPRAGTGVEAPAVDSVTPAGGPGDGGTLVAITGAGLAGATSVTFGDAPALRFTVVSDTTIEAVAPAGSGSVDVRVTTPCGESATGPGDRYTYVSLPAFADLPRTFWAYGAVMALAAEGVVSGYRDGTFRPDQAVTRAEFVKMTDLAFHLQPEASPAEGFADVPTGSWYAPYVAVAQTHDLVAGDGNRRFDPQRAVSRQELAVVLARVLRLTAQAPLTFADAGEIAPWARAAVAAVVAAGYLHGFPDQTFRPLAPATRAEAAAALFAALGSPSAAAP